MTLYHLCVDVCMTACVCVYDVVSCVCVCVQPAFERYGINGSKFLLLSEGYLRDVLGILRKDDRHARCVWFVCVCTSVCVCMCATRVCVCSGVEIPVCCWRQCVCGVSVCVSLSLCVWRTFCACVYVCVHVFECVSVCLPCRTQILQAITAIRLNDNGGTSMEESGEQSEFSAVAAMAKEYTLGPEVARKARPPPVVANSGPSSPVSDDSSPRGGGGATFTRPTVRPPPASGNLLMVRGLGAGARWCSCEYV